MGKTHLVLQNISKNKKHIALCWQFVGTPQVHLLVIFSSQSFEIVTTALGSALRIHQVAAEPWNLGTGISMDDRLNQLQKP